MERPRFPWHSITVRPEREGPALEGRKRLALLFRWLRNEAPDHMVVLDTAGRPIQDPLQVNWANFPIQDAVDDARGGNGPGDPPAPSHAEGI